MMPLHVKILLSTEKQTGLIILKVIFLFSFFFCFFDINIVFTFCMGNLQIKQKEEIETKEMLENKEKEERMIRKEHREDKKKVRVKQNILSGLC